MNIFMRSKVVGNERGVAFPIALLGLLVSSILISAVVVTSSTEGIIGSAHRDAVADLYAADGALQAYLADQPVLSTTTVASYRRNTDDIPVDIAVNRLAQRTIPGGTEEIFVLNATPSAGGRTVSAMVRVSNSSGGALNIQSATVFGGSANVAGNSALIHDGGANNFPGTARTCSADSVAANAVVHSATSNVTCGNNNCQSNSGNIVGGIQQSTLSKEELIRQSLGTTIRGLLPRAQVRFGAFFNESRFGNRDPAYDSNSNSGGDTGTDPSSLSGPSTLRALPHKYNWRCPGSMENCRFIANVDTTTYRIIAIDGENRDVVINGDHGQGMLIVINGRLRIQGNFAFRGVIVGEQDIDISGSSSQGGGAKIQGAVISQNNVNVSQQQAPGDTITNISGNAVIVYNRCAINRIIDTMNSTPTPPAPVTVRRTVAWAEIVR